MNGTDVELRKELWMWRGVMILFLAMLLVVQAITFAIDRRQHAKDNVERVLHWTLMETKQDNLRRDIDLTRQTIAGVEAAIKLNDEHLRQCSGCHSHPARVGGGSRDEVR